MINTLGATIERDRLKVEARYLRLRANGVSIAGIARRNRVAAKYVRAVLERAVRRDEHETSAKAEEAEAYRRKLQKDLAEGLASEARLRDELGGGPEASGDPAETRSTWLRLWRAGHRASTISAVYGVPPGFVRDGISVAARAEVLAEIPPPPSFEDDDHLVGPDVVFASPPERRLNPIFPVGYFTPSSPCPHPGEYPERPDDYCVVCCRAGRDRWRADAEEDHAA